VPVIVQSIRSDLRKMEHLLDILEQELAIFRRDEPPDFDILSGLVEYFRFYPECCHQPKETLVVAALKVQAPDHAVALAAKIGCRQAQPSLDHFAGLIEDVINEQEGSRESMVAAAADFAAQEKRHIEFAESELLPAANEGLTSQDWAALDHKVANKNDQLVEVRLEKLAERLGRWEREDQAERARVSQGH
jgi:hemerythrin-like domain-containing protein